MAINFRTILTGLRIFPKTSSTADSLGEIEVITGSTKASFHNGTTTSPVVTETHSSQGANRLTNKDLEDSSTKIVDASDTTKKIAFDAAGTTGTSTTITSSQTANRVLTLPDATTTVVGTDATQTLTNKTLTGNTAANLISGSGTLTLNTSGTITVPNSTDTLVGKATTDTLTNKTLSGNTATNLINGSGTLNINSTGTVTVPNATDTLVGKATTDTLTNKTLSGNTATNLISGSGTLTLNTTGTVTLPNATDTLIGRTTTDQGANRVKNKDLEGGTVRFVDASDTSKIINFDPSTAATTTTTQINTNATVNRVITLPDASDTLVGKATTDTLTNKSISGSTNTITNVSLTSGVTGALPIGNGGTGQATKAAAFDALSPMTTGGDIIYGGASGTGTRLANGSSGQVLTSNGTTLAPSWQTPATSTIAVRYTTCSTAVTPAGAEVILNFSVMDYDTYGSTVTTGASWKFTAPVAGVYLVCSHIEWSSVAYSVNNYVEMYIQKNGTQYMTLAQWSAQTVSSIGTDTAGAGEIYLNANDYISVSAASNRTGGVTANGVPLYTWISISKR